MLIALIILSLTAISYVYLESILRFVFAFVIAYTIFSIIIGMCLIIHHFYPNTSISIRNKFSKIKDRIYSFFRIKRKHKVEVCNA